MEEAAEAAEEKVKEKAVERAARGSSSQSTLKAARAGQSLTMVRKRLVLPDLRGSTQLHSPYVPEGVRRQYPRTEGLPSRHAEAPRKSLQR